MTTKRKLWFIRQTEKARLYCKVPPERPRDDSNNIWIPLSIIEHTTKRDSEHIVTLPEWFTTKNKL